MFEWKTKVATTKEAGTGHRVIAASLVSVASVGREIWSHGEVPVSPAREFFTGDLSTLSDVTCNRLCYWHCLSSSIDCLNRFLYFLFKTLLLLLSLLP